MKTDLLTPHNSTVIFIDHQPQMVFGITSIDRQLLKNNVLGLAEAAKIFGVPVILTTIESQSFSGYMWPELLAIFPELKPIERTSMNSWEDVKFVEAVKNTGKRKLIIAALWTEVCLLFPALCAIAEDYEVYAVVDASGGTSLAAHETAMQRMIQAGVIPVTWQQVMLEYQRDWSRKETYDAVIGIVKQHSGAYGMGVEYAQTMVYKLPATKIS